MSSAFNALALAVERAKHAHDRCPEGHRDEMRLYARLLEARVALLQAQLTETGRSKTGAEAKARALRRELDRAMADHAAAKERLLRAAKEALPKPRRSREAGAVPLIDFANTRRGAAAAETGE